MPLRLQANAVAGGPGRRAKEEIARLADGCAQTAVAWGKGLDFRRRVVAVDGHIDKHAVRPLRSPRPHQASQSPRIPSGGQQPIIWTPLLFMPGVPSFGLAG